MKPGPPASCSRTCIVAVPSADAGGDRTGASVPGYDDRARSLRRSAGNRTLRRPARRDIRRMEEEHRGTRAMSECRGQARWNQHAGEWIRVASEAIAADLGRTRGGDAGLLSPHHRSVWAATMHVREQLPGGPGFMLVRRALERIQEDRGGFHEGRKNTAIPAHCVGGLSLDAHAQGTEPGAGAVIRATWRWPSCESSRR